jgi:broad specificity phosphatase PhoE
MTDADTSIQLVRHAKAQSRNKWWGKRDRDRPLTNLGKVQSKSLAVELAARPVVRVLTSPFTRCVETVQPLADRLGIDVEPAEVLGEAPSVPLVDAGDTWVASAWLGGRALALVDQVVADNPAGDVVMCSHGDVIPSVMAALAGRDGLDIDDVHLRKGARFRLTFKGPKCVTVEAVAPP